MTDKAVFAGGCFWCTEAAFDNHQGIINLTCGYTGGKLKYPNYELVSMGNTGHYEALLIEYDHQINYEKLLDIFWNNIDPFDKFGQFYDRGLQYGTAIFYYNEIQHKQAILSKQQHQKQFNDVIQTQILPAQVFYPAEEYHQKYHIKNNLEYSFYKYNSEREEKLRRIWKNNPFKDNN